MSELFAVIGPIFAAGIWALLGYVNSWLGPDHVPDWSKMGLTFLIGIVIATFMYFTGSELTYDTMMIQMGMYISSVAVLDKALHALLKLKDGSAVAEV